MALIKCPECGKEISDKAEVCINCGYPLKELHENKSTSSDEEINVEEVPDAETTTEQASSSEVDSAETTEEAEGIELTSSIQDSSVDSQTESELVTDSGPVEGKRKSRKKIKIIVLAVIGIVVIVGIFAYFLLTHDKRVEEEINGVLSSNDFTTAYQLSEKIYDNDEKKRIRGKIKESLDEYSVNTALESANATFRSGDFDSALEKYESIKNSADVTDEIAQVTAYKLASMYSKVIKDSMKMPDSYSLNEVRLHDDPVCYYFDYSGLNGFGGASRSKMIFNRTDVYDEKSSQFLRYSSLYFDDSSDYTVLDKDIVIAGMAYAAD